MKTSYVEIRKLCSLHNVKVFVPLSLQSHASKHYEDGVTDIPKFVCEVQTIISHAIHRERVF